MSRAHYLVFDTETTGLPVRAERGQPPVAADDPRQPRLASFAAIQTDALGIEISRQKFYVDPLGQWSIDGTEAAAVNGLTDRFLKDNGVPVDQVLRFYSGMISDGLIVVAHHAIFDTKIMRGELRRIGLPDLFEQTRNICTMKALKPYVAEGRVHSGGFGRVSLANACAGLGIELTNAHDAMADAEACRAILEILIRDDRCPDPGITLSKHGKAA